MNKEKDLDVLKQRLSYWLGTYWVDFDWVYMKPKLVNNWPRVKYTNDIIAEKIKEAIKIYQYNKKHGFDNLNMNRMVTNEFILDKKDIDQNSSSNDVRTANFATPKREDSMFVNMNIVSK